MDVDHVFRTWSTSSLELLQTVTAQHLLPKPILVVANDVVCVAGRHNSVRRWDLKDKCAPLKKLCIDSKRSLERVLAVDGNLLFVAMSENVVEVWDRKQGSHQVTLKGHKGPVTAVALTGTRDSGLICTSSADATVRVWSRDRGRALHTLTGHKEPIANVCAMGELLFSFSETFAWSTDVEIRCWRRGEEHASLRLPPEENDSFRCISAAEGVIAAGSFGGVVYVWDGAALGGEPARAVSPMPAHIRAGRGRVVSDTAPALVAAASKAEGALPSLVPRESGDALAAEGRSIAPLRERPMAPQPSPLNVAGPRPHAPVTGSPSVSLDPVPLPPATPELAQRPHAVSALGGAPPPGRASPPGRRLSGSGVALGGAPTVGRVSPGRIRRLSSSMEVLPEERLIPAPPGEERSLSPHAPRRMMSGDVLHADAAARPRSPSRLPPIPRPDSLTQRDGLNASATRLPRPTSATQRNDPLNASAPVVLHAEARAAVEASAADPLEESARRKEKALYASSSSEEHVEGLAEPPGERESSPDDERDGADDDDDDDDFDAGEEKPASMGPVEELPSYEELLRQTGGVHSDAAAAKYAQMVVLHEENRALRRLLEPEGLVEQLFLDAIAFTVMRDPCFATDGYTYERHTMRRWLHTHDTSPLTGQTLPSRDLVANRALRKHIVKVGRELGRLEAWGL